MIRLRAVCWAVAAALSLSLSAPALAADWTPPFSISGKVTGGINAQVAMNASGDTVVAWEHGNNADRTVQASVRPRGGAFSPPVTVPAPGETARAPKVGIDGEGNATVVWLRLDGEQGAVRVSRRPAGGVFGPGEDVSEADEDAEWPGLAVGSSGTEIVTWVRDEGSAKVARALTRSSAGVVSGPVDLGAMLTYSAPVPAVDGAGNGMVVWVDADLAVQRSDLPSDGAFGPPARVSPPGEIVWSTRVAVGENGSAIICWISPSMGMTVLRAAVRDGGGGGFMPPVDLSAGEGAGLPWVSMNAKGDAAIGWETYSATRTRAAVRRAGGSFSDPPLVLSNKGSVPTVAINPAGDAFFAWREYGGGDDGIEVTIRGAKVPAGSSSVTASKLIAPSDVETDAPDIAVDGAGNAVVVWRPVGIGSNDSNEYPNLSSGSIGAAVFDAGPPQVTTLSIPSSAVAGTPVAMTAGATDEWSPVTLRFAFGDGTVKTGSSVTHTYAAAGAHTVTVTAVDAAGNAASATRQVIVSAPPGGGAVQSPSAGPQPDSTPTAGGPTAAAIKTRLRSQIVPKGAAAKLAKLAKAKRYSMRYTALTAGKAKVAWTVKSGGKRVLIASGARTFARASSAKVVIRVTAAGARLIKRSQKLKVTAASTFTAAGGASITVTKTFTLKR